jgi:uncharacterized GH25 family protein
VGYGHHFPAWEPIPAEEYPFFKVKLVGPSGEIPLLPAEPNYAWVTESAVPAGTYLAVADVEPIFWTSTPDGWSMKPLNETPGGVSCGLYVESAKGVANVGALADPAAVSVPVGLPLEIIPLANPATVKPGGPLPLKLLWRGEPLAGAPVYARYAGLEEIAGSPEARAFYGLTDRDGLVTVVPTVDGEWIVTARAEKPFDDPSRCAKEDYGTSLHFQILP